VTFIDIPWGQVRLQLGDGGPHARRNVQGVRFRLADDADPDAGLAVRTQRGLADVGAERYRGDIADARRAADDDVLEVRRRGDVRRRAHDEVLIRRGDRTGRGIEGNRCEGRSQVGDGEAEARQPVLVDIDAEDLVAIAVDLDVGDAGHGGQFVLDLVLDDDGHVLDRHGVRRHRQPHNRVGIGVGLDDARRIGGFGNLVGNAADGVAHIGGGDVEIDAVVELDGNAARAK